MPIVPLPATEAKAGASRLHATTSGDIASILEQARTIAVLGASPEPWRPSFGVMAYLKRAGYRVIPVNPYAVGQCVHGEPFRACLKDILEPVDVVDVFRRPEFLGEIVEDVIAVQAPVLWLQLGIRNDEAAARAEAAGIAVVQSRCISVEHSRLLG